MEDYNLRLDKEVFPKWKAELKDKEEAPLLDTNERWSRCSDDQSSGLVAQLLWQCPWWLSLYPLRPDQRFGGHLAGA